MHYAYLDESGNTTPFHPSERFLVVALVAASSAIDRALTLHLRRMRKAGAILGPELKAKKASIAQRKRLLQAIADEDIAIIALIVDKRRVLREPADPEDWYRQAVAHVAQQCTLRWPQLRLILDRRYNRRLLRDKLESAVRIALGDCGSDVAIEQLDSHSSPGLQIAD